MFRLKDVFMEETEPPQTLERRPKDRGRLTPPLP